MSNDWWGRLVVALIMDQVRRDLLKWAWRALAIAAFVAALIYCLTYVVQ